MQNQIAHSHEPREKVLRPNDPTIAGLHEKPFLFRDDRRGLGNGAEQLSFKDEFALLVLL
jgi:hypothetical protein